ncbi:MAG TPA: cellulase family glycosylhydrolase [Tepidisphaeraceae bacterium]|jgi:hypothetical protein
MTRETVVGFVLAWVALCTATCLAADEPAAPRRFAERVGVNVKFTQGQSMRDLSLLPLLGVRWVRDTAAWPEVEPVAGKYVGFPRAFADRLAFYKRHNIGVCFGLWYDNPAAYPNTAEKPNNNINAEAYGRYAAEVARLLKASGVRFVIELYNEPHNTLKHLGGKWNGEPPAPWLDHYVSMVHAAVREVKAFDPTVKLLAGDDMWVLQYRLLEKGLPPEIDCLTVHPYVRSWAEVVAAEPDTSWTQPFVTVDADRSVRSAVRRLRDHATEKLGRTPAIWITEWGWTLGESIHDREMTEDLLAAMVPRAYLTAADSGVEVLLWFSLQDSVDGPMGLTTNEGRRRLPFQAMQTMTQKLGRTTTLAHVVGADHRTSGLQAYRLAGEGADAVHVVWNINGDTPIEVSKIGPKTISIADVFGRPVATPPAADGRFRLTVGRSPLYLTGLAADAAFNPVVPTGRPPVYLFP